MKNFMVVAVFVLVFGAMMAQAGETAVSANTTALFDEADYLVKRPFLVSVCKHIEDPTISTKEKVAILQSFEQFLDELKEPRKPIKEEVGLLQYGVLLSVYLLWFAAGWACCWMYFRRTRRLR